MRERPKGKGLGNCPTPMYHTRSKQPACGCAAPLCMVCGHRKHTGVHMHCYGEKPGDPPWGHEYRPPNPPTERG